MSSKIIGVYLKKVYFAATYFDSKIGEKSSHINEFMPGLSNTHTHTPSSGRWYK